MLSRVTVTTTEGPIIHSNTLRVSVCPMQTNCLHKKVVTYATRLPPQHLAVLIYNVVSAFSPPPFPFTSTATLVSQLTYKRTSALRPTCRAYLQDSSISSQRPVIRLHVHSEMIRTN